MNEDQKPRNGVCRVCLCYKNNEKFVSLVDNNFKDERSCYGIAVNTFAQITIRNNDELPTIMCQNCLTLLKCAIHFKLKCEESEKRLKVLVKKYTQENSNGSNLNDIITQYSLFSTYFPSECTEKPSESIVNNKLLIKNRENLKNLDINNFQENKNEIKKMSSNLFEDEKVDENYTDDFECFNDYSSEGDSGDEILNILEKIIPEIDTIDKNHLDDTKFRIPDTEIKLDNSLLTKLEKNQSNNTKHGYKFKTSIKIRRLQRKLNAKRLFLARQRAIQERDQNKEFLCTICHRVLANQQTYDHHMQRHNGCRFICEHCGKGFPILVELQMHQVTRHGTGPFLQCQQCSYKAPRKLDLIEHERIHSGERPYTCDKCGLTFRRRAIWRKHMVYHTEKSVQCPHCPRKFFHRSEMQSHMNSVHERLYMYLCHKCDATYAKTETVRRHLTERHGIPREVQGKIVRVNKGSGSTFPEQ